MEELKRMKVSANLQLSRYGELLLKMVGRNEVNGGA